MTDISSAKEKMTDLEIRISGLENISSVSSSLPVVNESSESLISYQIRMLKKLKEVKQTLELEGGDLKSITMERDIALEESKALKKENEKLNYRIRHLIKSLNEEEDKNQKI